LTPRALDDAAGWIEQRRRLWQGREIVDSIVGSTALGRAASLEDVGNVAAFAASGWARTMTGTALNITCGTEID
jgi:3-oxoacyl-[acyl-carrier protein] reductase